jgi:hypothetical protein
MVSTGIKIIEFPIKHLVKTFILFYLFLYKAKSKRFGGLLNIPKLWVKHKTRINYSHCYHLAYNLVSYSSNFFHMSINSFIPSFLRSVLTIKSFPILVSVLKNIWVATPGSPPV